MLSCNFLAWWKYKNYNISLIKLLAKLYSDKFVNIKKSIKKQYFSPNRVIKITSHYTLLFLLKTFLILFFCLSLLKSCMKDYDKILYYSDPHNYSTYNHFKARRCCSSYHGMETALPLCFDCFHCDVIIQRKD